MAKAPRFDVLLVTQTRHRDDEDDCWALTQRTPSASYRKGYYTTRYTYWTWRDASRRIAEWPGPIRYHVSPRAKGGLQ